MVATFFWRPAQTAVLRVPPSPQLPPPGQFKQMQFSTWCKRVAKRYEAHKKPRPLGGKDKNKPAAADDADAEGSGSSEKKEAAAAAAAAAAASGGGGGGVGRRARRRDRRANPNPPAISTRPDASDERLALLGGPLLGREKYLGGLLGDDGKIYAIPGFARRVLRIDPSTGAVEYVGPEFPGEYKWLRGVKCPKSGALYGLPCHADTVVGSLVQSRSFIIRPVGFRGWRF